MAINNRQTSNRAFRVLTFFMMVLGGLLVGCSSTPPEQTFYTLSPSATANISDISGQPSVSIRRVKLPSYLNQPSIARKDSNGKVSLLLTERWAEKLSQAIPTVLAQNIESHLQSPVETHPLPPGIQVETIVEIDIQQFIADGDTLLLMAKYRLVKPKTLESFNFSHRVPLDDASTATLVSGYNQGIEALAKAIATELQ